MPSANRKNTLISIGLGVGALVFAFFMVLGDPQQGPQMMAQGGQIIQQIQTSAASIGKPQDQTALGPESRLDMTMNAPPLPSGGGMNDMSVRSGAGDSSKSSVDSYLDGAWDSPKASQQAQQGQMMQMPAGQQNFNRMPQPRGGGFTPHSRMGIMYRRGIPYRVPQRGFQQQRGPGMGMSQQGMPGGAQGMDFRKLIKEMNAGSSDPNASAEKAARTNTARGAVENELSVSRNQASEARGCMSRARNAEDRSEKQSAASEARSHASQAQAAASRARSRASGIPELQGLADQAHNFANQAENSANDAESAVGGW